MKTQFAAALHKGPELKKKKRQSTSHQLYIFLCYSCNLGFNFFSTCSSDTMRIGILIQLEHLRTFVCLMDFCGLNVPFFFCFRSVHTNENVTGTNLMIKPRIIRQDHVEETLLPNEDTNIQNFSLFKGI